MEANYNHTSRAAALRLPLLPGGQYQYIVSRRHHFGQQGVYYDTTIDTSVHFKITDYGVLRAVVDGLSITSALCDGGIRFRHATSSRFDHDDGFPHPRRPGRSQSSCTILPLSRAPQLHRYRPGHSVPYGYAAGAGLDYMLSPTFFLRAEYEFIQFIASSLAIRAPSTCSWRDRHPNSELALLCQKVSGVSLGTRPAAPSRREEPLSSTRRLARLRRRKTSAWYRPAWFETRTKGALLTMKPEEFRAF